MMRLEVLLTPAPTVRFPTNPAGQLNRECEFLAKVRPQFHFTQKELGSKPLRRLQEKSFSCRALRAEHQNRSVKRSGDNPAMGSASATVSGRASALLLPNNP
jgi:hypothetical protein